MEQYIKFNGKYDDLKGQGFRCQKLFADDRIHYIRDDGSVIDNSLFISKSGNWLRPVISLDYGNLSLNQFCIAEKIAEGAELTEREQEIQKIDLEALRGVDVSVKFIESIQVGAFDGDLAESTYANYAGREMIEMVYDVRTCTFQPAIHWAGSFMDKNRPRRPWYTIPYSMSKYQFDWMYENTKSGILTIDTYEYED